MPRAHDARMRATRLLVVPLVATVALAALHAFAADDVTIYRCVDAKGRVALRDTPCNANEKQETRTMVRPRDAAPRKLQAVREPEPEPEPEYAPATHDTYRAPPRPLFECHTPDGELYTSDTADGNPRWVPVWTLGYPVYAFPGQSSGVGFSAGNGNIAISGNTQIVNGPVVSPGAYGAGMWVRDTCYELPQGEVCALVRDRRDEIRRRFFNAMPSERDVLRVEERGLNARLENDCAAH
jgi:hypothetical protein